MGAVWLGSLPDVLRAAGLQVEVWPNWETRSRSTGGYNAVWAIGVHHDAISTGTPLEQRCRAAWDSATNPNKPVGAVWLHTDGRIMVGAAGATNTQGRGGPYRTSKGTIPLDQGNLYMLSIEASNNGVGETWPLAQQIAYVKMCAALCKWLGLDPRTDVVAHFEYTSRKIDPAGPSMYAAGANKWDMTKFRSDVVQASIPTTPLPIQKAGQSVIIDLNPSNIQKWVAMELLGNELTHLVNGHHVAVLTRGNTPRVTLGTDQFSGETELEGILLSVKPTNASPFGPGRPSSNPALHAAWIAAQERKAQ